MENSSLFHRRNLVSFCSEQMDVSVSFDVIMNAANCFLEHDRFGGGSVRMWSFCLGGS